MKQAIIIGSGFSGIGMAVALRKRGVTDFVILEKALEAGGVWRDNSYPGAACDIPSHLYSFSFEPNPDWSRVYAPQAEINDYLRRCIEKYEIDRHMRFGAEVSEARFNEETQSWAVSLADGELLQARLLITATGQLSRPLMPDIPGMKGFAGQAFHSARWDHDLQLEGKRVAVIGTGASAIQFLPAIVGKAAHVTVFQRSPAYVLPKSDRHYSVFEKWLFRHMPGMSKIYRLGAFLRHEAGALGFIQYEGLIRRFITPRFRHLLARQVSDETLREKLTPAYAIGCKRILLSNDYFSIYERPNVRLVEESITHMTPDGVQTSDGEVHPADIVIFGTGFDAASLLAPIRLVGSNGLQLHDVWREKAGGYLGIAVPGFPNFFMLYGPNTNLGHNSIIYMIESQIAHIMRCLDAMERRGATQIEVNVDPYRRFLARMRKRSANTVWVNCRSWYLDRKGQNTSNWPNFSVYYSWLTRRGSLAAYRLRGESKDGG